MPSIQIELTEKGTGKSVGAPKLKGWGIRSNGFLFVHGNLGQRFDFTSLNGQTALQTIPKLERLVKKFTINPAPQQTPSRSTVGYVLSALAAWGRQYPQGIWRTKTVSGSLSTIATAAQMSGQTSSASRQHQHKMPKGTYPQQRR